MNAPVQRKRRTFKRFKRYGSVALWIEAGKVENYPDPCDVCRYYKCECGA